MGLHVVIKWKFFLHLFIKMCYKFLFKTGGVCDHLKYIQNSSKYYDNPTMLSRVIAKTSGMFFETQCISCLTPIRIQHDFLTLIDIFIKSSSCSQQARNNFCRAVTTGVLITKSRNVIKIKFKIIL